MINEVYVVKGLAPYSSEPGILGVFLKENDAYKCVHKYETDYGYLCSISETEFYEDGEFDD